MALILLAGVAGVAAVGGAIWVAKKVLSPAPWRKVSWGEKARDLQYVENFQLQTGNQKIRILLIGPVGAGKSSFINSVQSVLLRRMYRQAGVGVGQQSYTRMYRTYKPTKGDGTFYPFVFSDIMGLEQTHDVTDVTEEQTRVDDIIMTLKGHVKDGYRFGPTALPDYNGDPSENDKVHVLVFVVPAGTSDSLSDVVREKMKKIREEARDLEIPQMTIFTKVDEFCPEIREDLKKVYRDEKLKKKMELFSAVVGIPLNCIFAVKNYHKETTIKDEVDSLILDALRNILDCGRDCIQFRGSTEN